MAKKIKKNTQAQAQAQQVQEHQVQAETQEQQEAVQTEAQQDQEQQEQYDLEEAPEWVQEVPEGTALARVTGTRENKEGMPLLVLTIVDKREKSRWDRVDEITVCPFRGYSFALGGSEGGGCYGDSTVMGLGNILAATELLTYNPSLFNSAVQRSNVTYGPDGSAGRYLLRALLCEALLDWLGNSYGSGIVLEPNWTIMNKFIRDVADWLEPYRITSADDAIRSREANSEDIRKRNKELEAEIKERDRFEAQLLKEKKELENELLRYKAAAAFSQVTIEELDKERRQIPSAKKELKKSIQRALLKYK